MATSIRPVVWGLFAASVIVVAFLAPALILLTLLVAALAYVELPAGTVAPAIFLARI